MLRITLHVGDLFPSDSFVAEAAGQGIAALIVGHLRERNASRPPSRYGLPKSNFWADAAKDVAAVAHGGKATVTVPKEGAALHYYGGTVRPTNGKKALAIPVDPIVAGVRPSEYDPTPKHEKTFITAGGAVGDRESGRILWILVPSVTLRADPSVLPTDDAMLAAAEDAVMEAVA